LEEIISLSFIDYNDEMRMEGQYTSFLSNMMPGRFYIILVCVYPSQECYLGLGNGGLLPGVHATWEQGQWSPFYKGSLPLGILTFTLSVKDTFTF
jgi:hypothetical protein